MIFPGLSKWSHRPGLDGSRAVAALLVVFFHAGWTALSGGYIGVDVFFVLSGFLITSILLRELNRGRLDFVAFYARRVRRLLPGALFVLLATVVALRVLPNSAPLDWLRWRPGAMAAALYGSNWWFLADAQDYFAQDHGASPFLHYWSLSVEEQFYLVWPVLLTGVGLVARRSPKAAFWVVVGLTLASLGTSAVVGVESPMESYFGTHARAWQPLSGAAVALGLALWRPPGGRTAQVLGVLGLLGLLAASLDVVPLTEPLHRGVLAVVAMVALLLGLEGDPASVAARLLSWKPARVLGDWSYAMYLWHWPVLVLGDQEGWLPVDGPLRVSVLVVVTVALSAASTTAVEQPVRRLSLEGRKGFAVACAGLVAVLAAAGVWALLPVDEDTRLLAEQLKPVESRAVIEGVGAHVVLVGDSHAAQWRPAFQELAREHDWTVTLLANRACPWPDGVWLDAEHGRALPDCTFELPEADVAILVSRAVSVASLRTRSAVLEPGAPGWIEAVEAGSRAAIDRALQLAAVVVILERIPEMSEDPTPCLSRGEEDCSSSPTQRPGDAELDAMWRRLAAEDGRVHSVDLDDLVCPEGVCLAEIDGVPTRWDSHHISQEYARALAPELLSRLPEFPQSTP